MQANQIKKQHYRQPQNSNFAYQNQEKIDQQRRDPGASGSVKLGADYYDEVGDAAEREAYYASVKESFSSASGQELYAELNSLVKQGHTSLGYKEARKHLYSEVDRRPDGGLYYIYSGEGIKNEAQFTEPAKTELTNYNCEHVVPQSWFNERGGPKADLHHLFTEQIECNGSRGNFPLQESDGGGEPIASCGIVDRDNSFEPNAGKGEVARATLYFITRYPGEVGDDRGETQPADLQQLLKWHKEYPVTDYERHRNETIQDIQGNRNPFIDFPELAEKVDFSAGFGRPRK